MSHSPAVDSPRTMNQRERNLDRITSLLGQCLGRIDEHAFRIQEVEDTDTTVLTAEEIDHETAELQELVGSLLDNVVDDDDAELNRIVDQAVRSCVAAVDIPLVVQQRLGRDLPRVACGPGQLTFAVQRALGIGMRHLEPGGELVVTTRRENGAVFFEMESRGQKGDGHLQERTTTLCDFVESFRGHCRAQADEQGTLLLALELPVAVAHDDS